MTSRKNNIEISNLINCWKCVSYLSKQINLKEFLVLFHEQLNIIPNDNLAEMFEVGASFFALVVLISFFLFEIYLQNLHELI